MSWTMIMLVLSATVLFWMGVAVLAALVVQLIILSLTQRRLRRGWALYKFQKRRESHEKTDPDL